MPRHTCSLDTCTGEADAGYASSSPSETKHGPDVWIERYAGVLTPTETTDPRY